MSRRAIVLVCLMLTVLLPDVSLAEAQQTKKVPVIGALWGSTADGEKNLRAGFLQGLQDLGYVEGKNILVSVSR
jgi:hypothetical protein